LLSSLILIPVRRTVFAEFTAGRAANACEVGYPALVLSLVGNGFIAFGLWVHHMFATGLPQIGEAYFTAASMMIAARSPRWPPGAGTCKD